MRRTLATLYVVLGISLVLSSDRALADDPAICVNASVTQKNEYRSDGGFTPVDGPVTEGLARLEYGNLDAFAWGAHNNETGKMNEVDVGLGYAFSKGDIDGRAGLERWNYAEKGGKNDALVGNVEYHGLPVDVGVNITELLDEDGTQVTGTVSKPLDLGDAMGVPFTLTPYIKASYLDDFFGTSGHSNNVYGLSLDGSKNKANFGVFVNRHDGKKGFGDSTQAGITFGYSF